MEVDEEEKADPLVNLLPLLLRKLDAIGSNNIQSDDFHLVEILSAVCLQTMLGAFMPREVLETFERTLPVTNPWPRYRVARSASR